MRQHVANRHKMIWIGTALFQFFADNPGRLWQLVKRNAGPAMVRTVQFNMQLAARSRASESPRVNDGTRHFFNGFAESPEMFRELAYGL